MYGFKERILFVLKSREIKKCATILKGLINRSFQLIMVLNRTYRGFSRV